MMILSAVCSSLAWAPLTRHNQLQLARLAHTNSSIDVNVKLTHIFTTILKIFSARNCRDMVV